MFFFLFTFCIAHFVFVFVLTTHTQLVAVVDDVYTDHSHIAGKFTMLSSSRVYVGGSVNPRALLGARVHNNFVGCLRKVCSQFLNGVQCKRSISIKYKSNISHFFLMFYNCIWFTQVEFSADTLRLNLIDLARTGSKLIQVAG